MQRFLIPLLGLLPLATPIRGEPVSDPAIENAATSCQACHQGALSLSRYTTDELVVRIEAIKTGEATHPPLGLDASVDIPALAEKLSDQPAEGK